MTRSSWFWTVVPLVGLIEILLHLSGSGAAPADADWDALRGPVQDLSAKYRNADVAGVSFEAPLIITAPRWSEPHARRLFGDELMPLQDVARPDTARYPSMLEIAIDAADSEFSSWPVLDRERVGPFELRIRENPAFERTYLDFVDRIAAGDAEVFSVTGRQRQLEPCNFKTNAKVTNGALHGHPTFPRRRFDCNGGQWYFVGATVIEDQLYRPRRCIWAHPKKKRRLLIAFDNVELQHRIHGYGALSWFTERELRGAPVKMVVRVNGETLGSYVHKDGEGWSSFQFTTEEYTGQRARVEFEISSKKPWKREFCFQADVR